MWILGVCWLVTNMNIHPINTKTFHTCLYFLSTLIHFWRKWLLKSTAIVKSPYCKETPKSKVNLLQAWNIFTLEPYNLILKTGEPKTLYFLHNIRHLKSITTTNIYRWFWFMRAQTCDFKHNHGVKVGRIHSSSSNILTPKAKRQQRAAGSSYTCSRATAYALRCTVCLSHAAQQDGESVYCLYMAFYVYKTFTAT